jgi:hypothetical protein
MPQCHLCWRRCWIELLTATQLLFVRRSYFTNVCARCTSKATSFLTIDNLYILSTFVLSQILTHTTTYSFDSRPRFYQHLFNHHSSTQIFPLHHPCATMHVNTRQIGLDCPHYQALVPAGTLAGAPRHPRATFPRRFDVLNSGRRPLTEKQLLEVRGSPSVGAIDLLIMFRLDTSFQRQRFIQTRGVLSISRR